MNKKVVLDFVKEGLRVAIFGAISSLVAYGLNQLGASDQTNTVVIVGTLVLKALDRAIHEDQSINSKGILPF